MEPIQCSRLSESILEKLAVTGPRYYRQPFARSPSLSHLLHILVSYTLSPLTGVIRLPQVTAISTNHFRRPSSTPFTAATANIALPSPSPQAPSPLIGPQKPIPRLSAPFRALSGAVTCDLGTPPSI
jgi:hypothetical protein